MIPIGSILIFVIRRILRFFLFVIWMVLWVITYVFHPSRSARMMISASTNILCEQGQITYTELEKIRQLSDKNYVKRKEK